MPEIFFNEEDHTYNDQDGRVPGVTGIIRDCLYDNEDIPAYMNFYLERGKQVHRACELYLNEMVRSDDRLICVNTSKVVEWLESISPDYKGYVLSFHKFMCAYTQKHRVKLLGVEKRVFEPLSRYAGTVDIKLQVIDLVKKFIWDIKCGAEEEWHKLQVGAYSVAETDEDGEIHTGGIVYLNKEGKEAWLKPVSVQANVDWRQMMAFYNLRKKYM